MREILFKAKHLDNGEWVEGIPIKTHIGLFMCFEENPHYCNQYGYMEIDEIVLVDENTLCQYTGLTDKNGDKIWENDVVRKHDISALGWSRIRNCEVSFDKLGYWLLTTEYGDGYWLGEFDAEQLEVIGNIFDNPELMENK